METIYDKDGNVIGHTEDWINIKDKYFKIMLTPNLAKELGFDLVHENGIWWVEVNKDKKSEQGGKRRWKKFLRLRQRITNFLIHF